MSTAVVFLDLISAFASMKRCLAVPGDDASDLAWKQHLLAAGFSPDETEAIFGLACNAIMWQTAGADLHTLALLCKAHDGTWFSVEGLAVITTFMVGALAGKPLAGLVFCAAVGRCLTLLHAELIAAHVLCYYNGDQTDADVFWNQTADTALKVLFDIVAYMDDVAIPIISTPEAIVPLVRTAIETAASVFDRFQFNLNYTHGKTNLILRIASTD